jgi:pimeloyl-ACP methyl ester carboxylesterase
VLQNKTATARLGWSPRLANPQLPTWLHRIDRPTLLLWGREDRVIPYACEPAWRAALPQARSESIAACGHAIHGEKPDEAAQRITAFIEGAAA